MHNSPFFGSYGPRNMLLKKNPFKKEKTKKKSATFPENLRLKFVPDGKVSRNMCVKKLFHFNVQRTSLKVDA